MAAAVSDYSKFRRGPRGYLRRVRSTVGAMLELSFGTPEEARRIVRRINTIHDQVNGRLDRAVASFPLARSIRRDSELLCWVHATLIESMVVSYELFVDPLTSEEKNRYGPHATWLACELGVEPHLLPRDYPAVEAHVRARYESGDIVVGDAARVLGAHCSRRPSGRPPRRCSGSRG